MGDRETASDFVRVPARTLDATIEFVTDDPNSPKFLADASSPLTSFVRFALWDNAFNATPPLLRNKDPEPENYVGADSRRFYIRLRQPSSAGVGTVLADWFTLDGNPPARLGDPPQRLVDTGSGDKSITLTEREPGVFTSRALMLACDDRDGGFIDAQPGLPLPTNQRVRGQSDFRIRKGGMFGATEARFPSGGNVQVRVQVPIFNRSPDERKRLPVQIFILKDGTGSCMGNPDDPANPLWTHLRILRESYERISIFAAVPGGPPLAPDSNIRILDAPPGVDCQHFQIDLNKDAGNPENPLRKLVGAISRQSDTVTVFYVHHLEPSGPGTLSGSSTNRSSTRVTVHRLPADGSMIDSKNATPYTLAHEIGHLLTDKPDSSAIGGFHFLGPTTPPAQRHTDHDLMRGNGTSQTESIAASKRLWNAPDSDGFDQVAHILQSPLLRNL
jgi:hypothetical protein